MRRLPLHLRFVVLALALVTLAPAAVGAELGTRFMLLSGRPGPATAGGERGVLVIPGLVMPLDEARRASAAATAGDEDLAAVAEKLERTLGLESIDVRYTQRQLLAVGQEVTLPAPAADSTVRVEVTLQGFNDAAATYRVRFVDGRSSFADSVVTVPRAKRALVGGLDGPEAPYLFLVVEPAGTGAGAGVGHVGDGITPPKAIVRPAPQYTAEAKEERIQGVVIVQVWIDSAGEVREINVLKGLPLGLSEAATEAIRQWRFEPALDRDGKPLDVLYNLTFNFRLADSAAPAPDAR
jgi:TonB family protein